MAYTNPSGNPSRILVSEEVYAQLKQPGYQIHLKLPDAINEEGSAENVVGYLPGKDHTKQSCSEQTLMVRDSADRS